MNDKVAVAILDELKKIRKAIEFSNEINAMPPQDIQETETPEKELKRHRAEIAQQIAAGERKAPK